MRLGAAGIAASAWLTWIDDLAARELPLRRLLGSAMDQRADTLLSSIAVLLREHAVTGAVRDADPDVLAQAFAGMLVAFGVLGPMLRGVPAGDPATTARTLTDLFLRGALASEAFP